MNYLLDFNSCFYCVFKVSHFDSVFFAFFELFDNILFNGNLGYSFFVGFSLVGFAVQFEFKVNFLAVFLTVTFLALSTCFTVTVFLTDFPS